MPDVLEGYDDDWAEREFWMTEMFESQEDQRYREGREATALEQEEFDVEVNPGGES